ncbi:MAG: carbohydrate-binding family 9-like protein [Phycisphaerales bacterium]|nr:carbohydrate-binding family 9-like protein [Phycisphaerales bacterium]
MTSTIMPVLLLAAASFASCALGGSTPPDKADSEKLPAYLVRFAGQSIHPDGHLDEKAWDSAPWSHDFVWIDAGDPAPLRSRFKALYNSEGLYFACEYELDDDASRELDPNFPYACEIMLDAGGTGRRVLEYAASPDGSQFSIIWHGRLALSQWTSELNINTHVGVSRPASDTGHGTIIFEIEFPWDSLKTLDDHAFLPPKKGDAWRANFSRVEQGENAGDFTWAPMGDVYYVHNPGHYGWLVFAGQTDPLTDLSTVDLKPKPDVDLQINESPHFHLFNQTMWALWMMPWSPSHEDANTTSQPIFVAGNTFVTLLNPDGSARWKITRRTADLPQFIRAVALVGDKLYVSGDGKNGMGQGMVRIDSTGQSHRLGNQDGYVFHFNARIISLGANAALIYWKDDADFKDHFQLITTNGLQPPVQTNGKVLCAARLGSDRIAVGTSDGFSCYDSNGKLIKSTRIAGGITSAAPVADAVVGVSGQVGIYRITADGDCNYYPFALRTKFDAIYPDGQGNCWASYIGGVAFITHNNIKYYNSPLNLAGLQVMDAVHTPDGKMVFSAKIPNADLYETTDNSAFLLITDGKHWQRYGFADGLPGQFTQFDSLVVINGNILFNSHKGIFKLTP